MNKHLRFDDDDQPVGSIECTKLPAEMSPPRPWALAEDYSGSDSESDLDYIEDGEDEDPDSSESYSASSDEEDKFRTLQTHVPALRCHRTDVDMAAFPFLLSHFQSVIELDAPTLTTLIGRVSNLIGWTMDDNGVDQATAVNRIVNTHPLSVMKYLAVLKGPNCRLKNGTVYNTLLDFGRWATYLAIYEDKNVDKFLAIVVGQQKAENKRKKQDVRERLSRENLVQNHQWPKGGMAELSTLLMKQKGRVDRLIQKAVDGECLIDKDLKFVSDWILSLLFVGNPQGRSQAVKLLSLERWKELCDNGRGQVTSPHLKTRATFGAQAINCNPVTQKYISAYVQYIRPHSLGSSPSTAVFVNLKGAQHQDVGLCVTRLFHDISKYHITTTTLRSLFETEAAEAMDRGTLSPGDCADVVRNNGHGSAASQNYYLKRKAEESGRKAVAVHAKLYGSDQCYQPPPLTNCEDALYVPQDDDVSDEEDKPRCRRRRIDWSAAELHHLMAWIDQFEQSRHGAAKNWRACLAAMTSTEVFDSHHLSTEALREAWRREVRKK